MDIAPGRPQHQGAICLTTTNRRLKIVDLLPNQCKILSPLYMEVIISIFHGCMVWIEKSVTRVTDWHHEASLVMPNSDPE